MNELQETLFTPNARFVKFRLTFKREQELMVKCSRARKSKGWLLSAGPEEIANAFSASFYLAGVNIDESLKKVFPSLAVASDEDESVKEKRQKLTANIAWILQ